MYVYMPLIILITTYLGHAPHFDAVQVLAIGRHPPIFALIASRVCFGSPISPCLFPL